MTDPSVPVRSAAYPQPLNPKTTMRVRIGFVALTDSAPLTVAEELGIFKTYGLDVILSRELGWASIRERILHGELDAAHAPAPMLHQLRKGGKSPPCDVFTSYFLNAGGNAITLSTGLRRQGVRTATELKRHLRAQHPDRPMFAMASRHSCHLPLLRQWLETGGINPDAEINLAVLPPEQMPAALAAGHIAGFCVSEPWNSVAIASGAGWCPATSASLAPLHPEKILLTHASFANRFPEEFAALLRAVNEACQWCEDPQNRPALVDILSSRPWFREVQSALRPALLGPFDCGDGNQIPASQLLRFHGPGINAPTGEKSAWILSKMRAAKLITASESVSDQAYRPDLLEQALGSEDCPILLSSNARGGEFSVSQTIPV